MISSSSSWVYRPALDGLRALAVVFVVLFHLWPSTFTGGFIGVDLFFVLSGYLITGLLLAESTETGSVDLRAFWARRFRRLMPAVLALVAVTSVITASLGTSSARGFANAWGALTWTTNWIELVFADRTWWSADLRTVLDHLWSLAVEEQFYLVWPLVVVFGLRRIKRPIVLLVGLLVASAMISGWVGPPRAYFRTDARVFELVIGALLAVTGWRPARRLASLMVGVGLVAWVLLVAWADSNESIMYPWGLLVVSVVSVALVAGSLDPPPWVATCFANPTARRVGQLSYGIYLWHIPIFRYLHAGRVGVDGPALHALRLAVLVAAVLVSFHWIEQPLRRGGPLRRSPGFIGLAVAAVASTFLLIPGVSRSLDRQWEVSDDRPPPRTPPDAVRVLVVGDLVSGVIGAGLDDADSGAPSSPPLAVWNTADLGCPFADRGGFDVGDGDEQISEFCRRWEQRWAAAIDRFDPSVIVVAIGLWDTLPWRIDGRLLTDDQARDHLGELAQRQADALAPEQLAGRSVLVVAIDDLAGLSPADQPSGPDRRRRAELLAGELSSAFGGVDVSGTDGTAVVVVGGAPTSDELQQLARTEFAQLVGGLSSANP